MAKVGIVYAANSKLPMMICVREDESELVPSLAGKGQLFLLADLAELKHAEDEPVHPDLARQKIADHHRIDVKSIPSGRAVLVSPDTAMVESGAIIADPELFEHETHHVIASDEAGEGHKYDHDAKQFLAAFATADAKTGEVIDVQWLPLGTKVRPAEGVIVKEAKPDVKVGDVLSADDLPVNVPSSGTTKF